MGLSAFPGLKDIRPNQGWVTEHQPWAGWDLGIKALPGLCVPLWPGHPGLPPYPLAAAAASNVVLHPGSVSEAICHLYFIPRFICCYSVNYIIAKCE